MTRAFFAVPLPDAVRTECLIAQSGIRLGRTVAAENLHVTLVFLGELDDQALEEAHFVAESIRAEPVHLALSRLDVFGDSAPRLIYAALVPDPGLMALQSKLETGLRRVGIDIPRRRFVAHVTLARLKERSEEAAPVQAFLAAHGGLSAVGHPTSFGLYASTLHPEGPIYEELASYPLGLT